MKTRRTTTLAWTALLALSLTGIALAKTPAGAVTRARESLQWTSAGIPGVSTAAVQGDMARGPSHFFLRYAAGFVAPLHHHTPDHYVTVVSGTLVLVLDGKEVVLPPGSFFALTNKSPHGARVEGSEDCVMSVDARGPWDVVPEKAASASR